MPKEKSENTTYLTRQSPKKVCPCMKSKTTIQPTLSFLLKRKTKESGGGGEKLVALLLKKLVSKKKKKNLKS
jgi:hypothetical protein